MNGDQLRHFICHATARFTAGGARVKMAKSEDMCTDDKWAWNLAWNSQPVIGTRRLRIGPEKSQKKSRLAADHIMIGTTRYALAFPMRPGSHIRFYALRKGRFLSDDPRDASLWRRRLATCSACPVRSGI
jgi:hypothetical protein